MKVKFREIRLNDANKLRLDLINSIIREYQKLGMRLTLRQLYYQLVSRDVIPNKQAEYAKLSTLLKEGRLGGIVDWSAIEDRLRSAESPSSWNNAEEIMSSAIRSYAKPRMEGQANYIEVWVEKDALSGVLSQVTELYHIPICVNRGYSSASAMYQAYERFSEALSNGQTVTILYCGDFDPSGMDMIRDVTDRPLEMLLSKAEDLELDYDPDRDFDNLSYKWEEDDRTTTVQDGCRYFDPVKAIVLDRFKVIPIALTRAQIDQYDPPPNPAKRTDPRSGKFIAEHGAQSWEVDALRPEVLNQVLTDAIEELIDRDQYDEMISKEQHEKDRIGAAVRYMTKYKK